MKNNFQGMDAGAAPNSLEPGFFQEMVNVDVYVRNVLRPRLGFHRCLPLDNSGALSTLKPTGYIASMSPLRYAGNVGHLIIDSSGNIRFFTSPGLE